MGYILGVVCDRCKREKSYSEGPEYDLINKPINDGWRHTVAGLLCPACVMDMDDLVNRFRKGE